MVNRRFIGPFLGGILCLAGACPGTAQTRGAAVDRQARLIGSFVPLGDVARWAPVMAEYGVKFTWIAVPWSPIEPARGVFFWRRLDEAVQAAASCGIDLGIRVYCRSPWATERPPSGISATGPEPSMPPRNYDDFANFVMRMAQRYRGRVSRYALENEAHSPVNWPASPESYFSLLAVFQRAVRAGDADALVQGGGISSDVLGALIAADMAARGKKRESVDFLDRYFARFGQPPAGLAAFRIQNDAGLETLVGTAYARRLARWETLFSTGQGTYDAVQLHYFAPADLLPEVMDWVRTRMRTLGVEKPVEFWQIGCVWRNQKFYDQALHAVEATKGIMVALGEGALRVVAWQFRDADGMPGLFGPGGARPAAEAFRQTAKRLNEATYCERLPCGKGIRAYRFIAAAGEVIAIWADHPCRVVIPTTSERVMVTDLTGNTITVRSAAVPVSDSPVFVQDIPEEGLETRSAGGCNAG